MSNILTDVEEENLHGFTGDIKDFLRRGDFGSELILMGNLRRYIGELKKKKRGK